MEGNMRNKIKKERTKIMQEFKAFITRGNVVDLAVGVIIGGAFGKIISSLVNDIIMPVIGILLGKVDFKELKYVLSTDAEGEIISSINYGMFIQYIIDFLIVAAAIFLLIKLLASFRKKAEALKEKVKKEEEVTTPVAPPAPPVPTKEEVLLTEIRDLLKEKK